VTKHRHPIIHLDRSRSITCHSSMCVNRSAIWLLVKSFCTECGAYGLGSSGFVGTERAHGAAPSFSSSRRTETSSNGAAAFWYHIQQFCWEHLPQSSSFREHIHVQQLYWSTWNSGSVEQIQNSAAPVEQLFLLCGEQKEETALCVPVEVLPVFIESICSMNHNARLPCFSVV